MENKNNLNNNESPKSNSRASRNSELYKSIYDISSYNKGEAIDIDTKEIDLETLRKTKDRESYQQVKPYEEVIKVESKPEVIQEELIEEKVYDINSIIERAKENKEIDDDNYNKFKNTQYDILSRLNIKGDVELEKVDLQPEVKEEQAKELKDLFNTITHKDLKKDLGMLEGLLPDNDNTIITESIVETVTTITEEPVVEEPVAESLEVGETPEQIDKEEIIQAQKDKEIKELDNSFYTGSFKFTNNDIEGIENINSTVKTNNIVIKILLFLLGVIFTTIILFVVNNYITF